MWGYAYVWERGGGSETQLQIAEPIHPIDLVFAEYTGFPLSTISNGWILNRYA